MAAPWAMEEMKTADLEDKRLNRRLASLLSALGERPTASIPAACGGLDDTVAAYRFFDNDKATFEKVMAPHGERTLERIAAQPGRVAGAGHHGVGLHTTASSDDGRGTARWFRSVRRVFASAGRVHARRHAAGNLRHDHLGSRRTARRTAQGNA